MRNLTAQCCQQQYLQLLWHPEGSQHPAQHLTCPTILLKLDSTLLARLSCQNCTAPWCIQALVLISLVGLRYEGKHTLGDLLSDS